MSDRKSRIFATIVIILIVVVISFLFMTRENYVRYSFYDATGCQYIEVTKMENAKGENSIKHLSLYKYGYFKPCYTIPKGSAEGVFMAYNDDNDLLFTISAYFLVFYFLADGLFLKKYIQTIKKSLKYFCFKDFFIFQ